VIGALLADLHHEEFWMLVLNRANEVTHRVRMSVGGTSGTVVDCKLIFTTLLEEKAAGFIAVHNHPSGSLEPSNADIELTNRMKTMGRTLDLPCLDHLIISHRGYYSFTDEGVI
jgi:DNA repair protein RadC